MKGLGIAVACSVCGKRLRGTQRIVGISVGNHKDDTTGRRCTGSDEIDHIRVGRSYYASGCGHEHKRPVDAGNCPQRGHDGQALPLPVVKVTIRPERDATGQHRQVTKTEVVQPPKSVLS